MKKWKILNFAGNGPKHVVLTWNKFWSWKKLKIRVLKIFEIFPPKPQALRRFFFGEKIKNLKFCWKWSETFCFDMKRVLKLKYRVFKNFRNFPLGPWHRPLTIDHLPWTTYHWPLTIDHWPLTIGHLPWTTYHWPLTIDHLPLTIYHLPFTTYHQNLNFAGNGPKHVVLTWNEFWSWKKLKIQVLKIFEKFSP